MAVRLSAIGDSLTTADLRIFCELTAATSGWYDGFGTHDPMSTTEGDFWAPYDHVRKHRHMVAPLPPVKLDSCGQARPIRYS